MKKICFGITGAISASIVPAYIVLLGKLLKDVEIHVLLTENSGYFLAPGAIRHYPNVRIHSSLQDVTRQGLSHMNVVNKAELFVICPATANFLGKAANGLADDLLSLAFIAADCPKIVMPAMNYKMFSAPAVRRNLATLAGDGVQILPPKVGVSMQSGESGVGALADPQVLLAAVSELITTEILQ